MYVLCPSSYPFSLRYAQSIRVGTIFTHWPRYLFASLVAVSHGSVFEGEHGSITNDSFSRRNEHGAARLCQGQDLPHGPTVTHMNSKYLLPIALVSTSMKNLVMWKVNCNRRPRRYECQVRLGRTGSNRRVLYFDVGLLPSKFELISTTLDQANSIPRIIH